MNRRKGIAAIGAGITLLLGGCSSAGSSASGFGSPSADVPGLGGGGQDGSSASPAPPSVGGNATLTPETKSEGNFRSPVATGNIVWIANPVSGRVAYIDAQSFAVQTVAAGDGPTYLAAVPDPKDDVAIVLNVRSQDATLLRDHQGTLSTARFPSTADANSWAISANGRWAIAWTDATLVSNPDPTQSFQDIEVIDLTGARPASTLTVGYRPEKFAFGMDGSHAFAVTQDGISVIDLLGGALPSVTRNYPLSDPAAPTAQEAGAPVAGAPDVSFTPNGAYALVRRDGLAAITIVALDSGTLVTVPLAVAPSDLSLSPEGDFAVAVLRDTSTVVLLPLPAIVTSPLAITSIPIPGETIGRAVVAKGGKTLLLFTTVAPIDRLTILSIDGTPKYRTASLHSPLLAVFPTDDAQNAIVLHRVMSGTVQGAFSIVPIAADLPARLESLPAPPVGVALAPTSDRALITTRDATLTNFGAYLADMNTRAVQEVHLASPPIGVGIVAGASRGFVAQDYAEGRISFVDYSGGAVRTITGFELGSRVDNGGTP